MNFKTLNDIKNDKPKQQKGPSDFYTGGQKSGLAIQSPDEVKNILKKAKMNTSFQKPGQKKQESTSDTCRITLYQNGFQIEEGPIRDFNSPQNKKFMEELNNGLYFNQQNTLINEREIQEWFKCQYFGQDIIEILISTAPVLRSFFWIRNELDVKKIKIKTKLKSKSLQKLQTQIDKGQQTIINNKSSDKNARWQNQINLSKLKYNYIIINLICQGIVRQLNNISKRISSQRHYQDREDYIKSRFRRKYFDLPLNMKQQRQYAGLIPLKMKYSANNAQNMNQNNPSVNKYNGLIKINIIQKSLKSQKSLKIIRCPQKQKKILTYQKQLTVLLGQLQLSRIIIRALAQLIQIRMSIQMPDTIRTNMAVLLLKLSQLRLDEMDRFVLGIIDYGMQRAQQFRKSILFTDFKEVIQQIKQNFQNFVKTSNVIVQRTNNNLLNNILNKDVISHGLISTSLFLLSMAFRQLKQWALLKRYSNQKLCQCFMKLDQVAQVLRLLQLDIPMQKFSLQLADIETSQSREKWIKQLFCMCGV